MDETDDEQIESPDEVEESWDQKQTIEGDDEYQYDLYNLATFKYQPVEINMNENFEEELYNLSSAAAQGLINKLFQCPSQPSEVGPVAQLPSEKTRLPREKIIPEPKPLTKWEKFAKQKGITKTAKERMVYDEDSGEYKPRYGYKRSKNGLEDIPIVEVKAGADPYADPWSEDRKERKSRVAKNLDNKMKNELRRMPKKAKYDPATIPGIPLDIDNENSKRGKEGIRHALQLTQISTASMGRFDEMRPLEPERKLKGKKRSFRDNFTDMKVERAVMKSQLRIVDDKIDKKKRGVTNSLKAYEGLIPDAPSDSFRAKKGKGSSSSSPGGGSSSSATKSSSGGKGKSSSSGGFGSSSPGGAKSKSPRKSSGVNTKGSAKRRKRN